MGPVIEPRRLLCAGIVAILFACLGSYSLHAAEDPPKSEAPLPEIVDFAQDVQPIFRSRCYTCHGPAKQTNGLRLDRKEAALQGGTSGRVIVPGSSAQSKLIQRAASSSEDFRMPPIGPRLTAKEIATLTSWIDQGAKWPLSPPAVTQQVALSQQKQHWSFQPVRRPSVPRVRQQAWVRNPIDAFVLAKLESKDISPAPEADQATLIRRLSLDLLGLPPTPTEVDAFVSDTRPHAYERLVHRLLGSPHYGERWGRHWLDLARYADSNGYNHDAPREIWMYRDWVIDALNRDLPFDQFVIEQIAGDLLPAATKQQIVATGFHRNTLINLEGGIDFDQYRVEAVVDRVETTGAVFLGLTLGCARCHDHKYDPVSQQEFYQFYAFFNNIDELGAEYQLGADGEVGRARAHEPMLEFGTAEQLARREAIRTQIAVLEKELEEYEKPLLARLAECCETLTDEEQSKLKPEFLEILGIPPEERSHFQKEAVEGAFREMDLGYTERQAGIKALRDIEPKVPSTLVMRELPEPRQAYVHLGGDFLRKGIDVKPGVPAILPPLPESESANRLDLARWLVDAKNPLTPRVTVNRIWQRYFGRGLVETENNFGTQGSPCSHPDLLDWLASEFIAQGWSLKAMHSLIVNSATYRQSSAYRPELAEMDPTNRLLGRQARLRLEAEIVRDTALAASGLFTPKVGGPSVFPPQPEGIGRLTQVDRHWAAERGADRFRRGMYTYFWRASPHPGLMLFDASDSTKTCTRRNRSNTPLQALTLLNDKAFQEFAQGLATRVLREAPDNNSERVSHAFRVCLGRQPRPTERARLEQFLAVQLDDFLTHPEKARQVVGQDAPEEADIPQLAAWLAVSRVLLNLDEFVTRE